MEQADSVLAFQQARLAIDPAGGISAPITLALPHGALVLAAMRGPQRARAFADAALGLRTPLSGVVLFQGRDWTEVPDEHAAAMRGRTGRLFDAPSWLPGLGIDENILLAPLFHTTRPVYAIREEAARLAVDFGLPGLPRGTAETATADDLHRAGLVRAFLGQPALIILENPLARTGREILPPLMEAIRTARDRGAAVLWLDHETATVTDMTIPATTRLRFGRGILDPLLADAA